MSHPVVLNSSHVPHQRWPHSSAVTRPTFLKCAGLQGAVDRADAVLPFMSGRVAFPVSLRLAQLRDAELRCWCVSRLGLDLHVGYLFLYWWRKDATQTARLLTVAPPASTSSYPAALPISVAASSLTQLTTHHMAKPGPWEQN